jgi:hypothetical protein
MARSSALGFSEVLAHFAIRGSSAEMVRYSTLGFSQIVARCTHLGFFGPLAYARFRYSCSGVLLSRSGRPVRGFHCRRFVHISLPLRLLSKNRLSGFAHLP